jgi:hypothetical protein
VPLTPRRIMPVTICTQREQRESIVPSLEQPNARSHAGQPVANAAHLSAHSLLTLIYGGSVVFSVVRLAPRMARPSAPISRFAPVDQQRYRP